MDAAALKKENKKLKGLLKDAVGLLDKYKHLMLNGQPAADNADAPDSSSDGAGKKARRKPAKAAARKPPRKSKART